MVELLTSDGALFVFTTLGIAATAVSIVRDAKARKAQLVVERVPVELSRAL